jgi:aminoglycoside N3'-acetyltransferase
VTYDTYGDAFDAAHAITVECISQANVRFFRQRAAVDFAIAWMERNRDLNCREGWAAVSPRA